MKKICVVTGSRAEYGLIKGLMRLIQKSSILDLEVVVTGTHLSRYFGETLTEILNDGFEVKHKVNLDLSTDAPVSVSKSIADGFIGFSEVFSLIKPHFLILLGDRYETFAAAGSAHIARIPIIHLHGGELTEGSHDDAFRHAITKMSQFHFVSTDTYLRRVIQLGEQPDTVFNVGAFGVDAINQTRLLSRSELASVLDFELRTKNLIITFHPATLVSADLDDQLDAMLDALGSLKNVGLIFTMSNADFGGKKINLRLKNFCDENFNAKFFTSLGPQKYFSCLKHFDGVIGNSSSGIIEAPYFNVGTVNIGDRQKGRVRGKSVIDCEANKLSILRAIDQLFSNDFQQNIKSMERPYGIGGAARSVLEFLERQDQDVSCQKSFFDIVS